MTDIKETVSVATCQAQDIVGLLEALDEAESAGSSTPRTRGALIAAALRSARELGEQLDRLELKVPSAA